MHRHHHSRRAGFSLVELMVVVVILGLLATLVVPNAIRYLGTAKREVARAQLAELKQAIDLYLIDRSSYPSALEDLLEPDEDGLRPFDQPELPADPWGNEYVYEPPDGSVPDLVLYSLGADGSPGGEGKDADIHWYPKRKD